MHGVQIRAKYFQRQRAKKQKEEAREKEEFIERCRQRRHLEEYYLKRMPKM